MRDFKHRADLNIARAAIVKAMLRLLAAQKRFNFESRPDAQEVRDTYALLANALTTLNEAAK